MTTETNINELLQLLDSSNNILIADLTYSSTIEDSIKQNGGVVVYSYNNIIVASEISETLYGELQKNPNIDYIESLALKQYGEVSSDLISKMDSTNQYITGNSGDTTSLKGIVNANTSGTDGKSGNSGSSGISGVGPTILNSTFSLSASTNEIFNYTIITSGTTPIDFAVVQPSTYFGTLALKSINIINGQTSTPGVYNIKFLATNDYGTDIKFLTLSITEPTKITNTNLNIYNRIGSQFYYTIESSGAQPKIYDVPEVTELVLDLTDNIIGGVFDYNGVYTMTLIVSGATQSDAKTLIVNVGDAPIITSGGEWIPEQNGYSSYTITSNFSATYNVIGVLPQGLSFSVDTISGNPIQQGEYYVTLMATNPYGEDSKDLKITVYQMGQMF
jgi:hypothetical protein